MSMCFSSSDGKKFNFTLGVIRPIVEEGFSKVETVDWVLSVSAIVNFHGSLGEALYSAESFKESRNLAVSEKITSCRFYRFNFGKKKTTKNLKLHLLNSFFVAVELESEKSLEKKQAKKLKCL